MKRALPIQKVLRTRRREIFQFLAFPLFLSLVFPLSLLSPPPTHSTLCVSTVFLFSWTECSPGLPNCRRVCNPPLLGTTRVLIWVFVHCPLLRRDFFANVCFKYVYEWALIFYGWGVTFDDHWTEMSWVVVYLSNFFKRGRNSLG